MSNLFERITSSTRKQREESKDPRPVSAKELERVAAFHSYLLTLSGGRGADRRGSYLDLDGANRFDRETALNKMARVRKIAGAAGIEDLGLSVLPAGRNEAGEVMYAVDGWIAKPKQRRANAVSG